jgi:cobalt-zinc-cadmium efflux system protein
MQHQHQHGHAHRHERDGHVAHGFGRAFALGTALNLAFVLVEAGFGIAAGSTALLADAGHNLSDALGLVVAWVGAVLSQRPPSGRYTYGLRGSSILAALFNAMFLLLGVGAIAWEAVQRLIEPAPVAGLIVMVVAAIGILVNAVTAWLFAAGRGRDLNIRGAYWHMVADAGVSAGVVGAGLLIWLSGSLWIDPAVSLAIVAVIVWGTWGLLRDSLAMSLSAVPAGIDLEAVRAMLAGAPGVARVHDLHVWPMSTTETALTAHLVMPGGHPGDAFLMRVADELRHQHTIAHVTLQIEIDPSTACALEADHVV